MNHVRQKYQIWWPPSMRPEKSNNKEKRERFETRPLSTKTVKPRDTDLLEIFGVHLDARGH